MCSKQHSFNAKIQVTMISPTALSQSDGQLPQLCHFLGENEDEPLDIIGLSHYTFFKATQSLVICLGQHFPMGCHANPVTSRHVYARAINDD